MTKMIVIVIINNISNSNGNVNSNGNINSITIK